MLFFVHGVSYLLLQGIFAEVMVAINVFFAQNGKEGAI
jgi:hypothetical protein